MAITKKRHSKAAMRLQPGRLFLEGTDDWLNDLGQTLGTGNAFTYEGDLIPDNEIPNNENAEIDGNGFFQAPIELGYQGTATLEMLLKFEGFARFFYHAFGYERPKYSPVDAGAGYYSHLFELDPISREVDTYSTTDLSGLSAQDKVDISYDTSDIKNRAITLGIALAPSDYRTLAMAKKMTLAGTAGAEIRATIEETIKKWTRGDYSSSAWTHPTGAEGSTNIAKFYQLTFKSGTAGNVSNYGIKDFNIEIDFDHRAEFDSESATVISEPILLAMQRVTGSFTINKHSVTTWEANKEAWNDTGIAFELTKGSYKINLYIPRCKIMAKPSGGDVSDVTVNFIAYSYTSAYDNPFAAELGAHTLIHYSPIYAIVQDTDSNNQMRLEAGSGT